MKKLSLWLMLCMITIALHAQDKVIFEFSDGIGNETLKTRMEQQVS